MCAAHIDIGYVGLPPAIIGVERGCRLVCVAGGHIEGTVLIGRADVKALDQCATMAEFLAQFSGIHRMPTTGHDSRCHCPRTAKRVQY